MACFFFARASLVEKTQLASILAYSVLLNTKTALFKANVATRLSLNFVMAPCKRLVKTTRHLIRSSCSNWVDFVKSGCEKSWAEVQADSFSFECRGCTRMQELEVELEQLRLLVVAMVGRWVVPVILVGGQWIKWGGRRRERC